MAAVAAFIILLVAIIMRAYTAESMFAFVTVIVGLQAVWRVFLVWLAFSGLPIEWAWVEEWLGPTNATLMFLLMLAIGLTALFQLRRRLEERALLKQAGKRE